MEIRSLALPSGYDASLNPRVTSFLAQMDDQLAALKKQTAGLTPAQLHWQPRPGANTMGMLIAHIAIVEVWWIQVAPRNTPEPEWESRLRELLGIGLDDDGMPLREGALPPERLRGKTIDEYVALLDRARALTHAELKNWNDAELSGTYSFRNRLNTREWTLYHALEHFSGHYGQILLLKHLSSDVASQTTA